MTRVPLPDAGEATDALPGLTPSIDLATLDVIRAQANNPAVLAAVLEYVQALYDELPGDVRELTILAVAHAKDSAYEWHQHVPAALDVGVSGATVRAIGRSDLDALAGRDRAVVEFARAQALGEVTDEHVEALTAHVTVGDVVAISRLAANYAGTADMIDAFDLAVEGEFVGWVPGE